MTFPLRRLLFVVVVFCTGALAVMAQGGSYYSVFGIGDIRRTVGALYDGMAGTSLAMPSTHGINLSNPALLGMSPYTRLQMGYRFNQYRNSLGGASLAQNNGEIDGILGLFGIDTAAGVGVTFGVVPVSSVNYQTSTELRRSIDGRTVTGRSVRSGEGGVSALVLGASGRLAHNLYVGASMQSLFGTITLADQVSIDGGTGFVMTQITAYDLRGILWRGGVYWTPVPNLNIGAVVSGGADGSVRNSYRAAGYDASNVSFDSLVQTETASGLPLTLGIGASLLSGKFLFGADVETTDYTALSVHRSADATVGRSLRASVGFSRPGAVLTSADFLDRMGYHGGIGFEQLYHTVRGSTVSEYYGAFGTDFPMGGAAIVDASVNIGVRQAGANDITSLFARLFVTVSIGEIWFKPFDRE